MAQKSKSSKNTLKQQDYDYSDRYGPDYSRRCAVAWQLWNAIAGGKCCYCCIRQAKQLHHTSYGDDKLGVNWFPLCLKCHKPIAHNKANWVSYEGQASVWHNHNKAHFVRILQNNYKKLSK